ncbi:MULTISPECIES: DUF433 domain-containing protein [Rhizobium]|uniref:DUF433 domain-containing protein n=7 Tax=Rhizobium TaxID=379 RepID=A0A6P1CEW4_RHITR|nr:MULTISPECIES: DUF433 domain-containing protein [Rhizobium]AGB73730.1 hypothetical protein RTCIAT899_PB02480 [Rhizobium tropici CIAT 899]ENN87144.1 hypothetical protein RHSP_79582 [Rhizobium freirei PRF 81]MBB4245049.1 uncharacterized protein (DUF433 family) [Rhizobium tropici]MBB4569977.1 uncharacterized protein (DUF433 family) [Rhizobium leucaenae]MBB5576340.1 uncharacterized protein (DUF433 family) [Rhizobium paranaense]
MPAVAEMLKASEAAVVSRVSLRDVNRVIDEHILPEAFISLDNGRHVLAGACSLITFYFESARRLTSEERLSTIRTAEARLARARTLPWSALLLEDWTVHHEFLTIDLMPFMRGASERLDDLAAAREVVTSSADILGGTPVIRGTRVPVHDVAASVSAGNSTERILETWPGLDREKIRLATIYAEANPLRGRPRVLGELPEGSVILTDRRVPRRTKAG